MYVPNIGIDSECFELLDPDFNFLYFNEFKMKSFTTY